VPAPSPAERAQPAGPAAPAERAQPAGPAAPAERAQPAGPAAPAERIGLFGGTFDPPHVGHAAALRTVSAALLLDRLLLVVANDPWQKSSSRAITPAADRYAMAQALAEGIPGVEASRLEIDRGGPSYTVTTVEALRAEALAAGRPAPQIYLVIGADLLADLDTWERADDLRRLVILAVVSRPPTTTGAEMPRAAPPGWRVEWVDGPLVDVSSSAVRDVLERGGPVDDLVPAAVMRCIRRRNLYAVGR
jgi:nicotinate-nucleotide adenylyltransferase